MAHDPEFWIRHLPPYLASLKACATETRVLSLGAAKGYFMPRHSAPHAKTIMQGDVWDDCIVIDFESGHRHQTKGIVLSNSCDVSPDNRHDRRPKVAFAPVVALSQLRQELEVAKMDAEKIENKMRSIKKQDVHNMFYLPANAPLPDEYVAMLGDVHSMPAETLRQTGQKLLTLSMTGYYFFVFKLSIHFCRIGDVQDRTLQAPA